MGGVQSNLKVLIWKAPVPGKLRLSTWMGVQGRCLTTDLLAKRGWQHNPFCALRRCHTETALHLLFMHCSFSLELWKKAFQTSIIPLDRLPTVGTHSFRQWWEQGFDSFARRDLKMKWSSTITVVAWFIWTERNAGIFRGMATSVASLMQCGGNFLGSL